MDDYFLLYAFLLPVVGIHSALVVRLGGFSSCDFVKNWFNLFFGYLHFGLIIAVLDTVIHVNQTHHLKAK